MKIKEEARRLKDEQEKEKREKKEREKREKKEKEEKEKADKLKMKEELRKSKLEWVMLVSDGERFQRTHCFLNAKCFEIVLGRS